jgi:hypothetical protein
METPLTVVNDQPKLGFFSRLAGLFTGPGRVFAWLREKPDFVWPVIFLLISVGFSIPIGNFQTKLMAETFPKYADAMAKAPVKSQATMVIGIISGLFTIIVIWMITTLIYKLFAKIAGGETTRFTAALSMIGYTYLASSLQSLFQGGILLANGSVPPLGFEAGMELSKRFFTPTGLLLAQINPFAIGGLILTCIALEKGFKLTRGKAITIAILIWIAGIGIQAGLSSFSLGFLK